MKHSAFSTFLCRIPPAFIKQVLIQTLPRTVPLAIPSTDDHAGNTNLSQHRDLRRRQQTLKRFHLVEECCRPRSTDSSARSAETNGRQHLTPPLVRALPEGAVKTKLFQRRTRSDHQIQDRLRLKKPTVLLASMQLIQSLAMSAGNVTVTRRCGTDGEDPVPKSMAKNSAAVAVHPSKEPSTSLKNFLRSPRWAPG